MLEPRIRAWAAGAAAIVSTAALKRVGRSGSDRKAQPTGDRLGGHISVRGGRLWRSRPRGSRQLRATQASAVGKAPGLSLGRFAAQDRRAAVLIAHVHLAFGIWATIGAARLGHGPRLAQLPAELAVYSLACVLSYLSYVALGRARRPGTRLATAVVCWLLSVALLLCVFHVLLGFSSGPPLAALPQLVDRVGGFTPALALLVVVLVLAALPPAGRQAVAAPPPLRDDQPERGHFWLRDGRRQIRLDFDAVTHLTAERDYVRVHTEAKDLYVRGPLKTFLAQLPAEVFTQVSRSAIVRIDAIHSLERRGTVWSATLPQGKSVTLGRNFRRQVRETVGARLCVNQ